MEDQNPLAQVEQAEREYRGTMYSKKGNLDVIEEEDKFEAQSRRTS